MSQFSALKPGSRDMIRSLAKLKNPVMIYNKGIGLIVFAGDLEFVKEHID